MRIILNTGISRMVLAPVVGLALIGFAACSTSAGSTGGAPGGRIEIAVAENFWGSVVGQLAGADATVTSIISNPATDPHDYEPTARDARTIASARYVIVNGVGYDSWAQKLIDADPSSDRTVLDVGNLLGLDAGANPHQWYSPTSVHRFIVRVTRDLGKIDPRHRAGYDTRARAFESSGLRAYDALIARIRARFAGTPIGASESIVSPMADALGLRVLTPARFLDAIAEGNEPTESDKASADAQIAGHRIKVFVFNRQNATPDVQRLVDAARREHIPVATVTETLAPATLTFQAWQVRELRALLSALEEGARS